MGEAVGWWGGHVGWVDGGEGRVVVVVVVSRLGWVGLVSRVVSRLLRDGMNE